VSADPRRTEPIGDTRLVTALQIASALLLVLSSVMLPIFSGTTGASLRLLTLALAGAGAFFWFLCMIFRRRLDVPWGWIPVAGGLVLVSGAVSGLMSDCPGNALVTLITWVGYAAGFVLAVWVGRDAFLRRHVLRAICAVAVPIAVYGILQYAVLLDITREYVENNPEEALQKLRLPKSEYAALLQRTKGKRVFATFALPNTLAAYLLLLLPPTLALLAVARKLVPKLTLLAAVIAMLMTLFFTFSKAGWLTGAVILLLFIMWYGWRWVRERWVPALTVLLIAAGALGAGLWGSPYLRARLVSMSRELKGSTRVRRQYWQAGLSMWRESPVVGIGPGNFANHYMKHKPVAAEEVKQAHNDYVQLLAECGPVAAVAYIGFWSLIILGTLRRRYLAPPTTQKELVPPHSRGVVIALIAGAGILGIVAASFFGQSLAAGETAALEFSLITGFIALWLGTYLASGWLADTSPDSPGLRLSLALGLLAFALHSVVDLNLYVDGLAFTAFVIAGLATATWLDVRKISLKDKPQIALLLGATVCVLSLYLVVSRVSQGDSYRAYGTAALRENPLEAREAAEHATQMNPLDHRAFAELAGICQADYAATRAGTRLDAAAAAWAEAIRLNPTYSEYHAHLSKLFSVAARTRRGLVRRVLDEYRQKAKALSVSTAGRDELLPALVEAHLAIDRAPTRPYYRISYGSLLDYARLPAEALKQYRLALDLHEQMVRGKAPKRQLLTPKQVSQLRDRLALTESGDGAIIRE
jgi:tetratricopeptide (TPR) repeat protein